MTIHEQLEDFYQFASVRVRAGEQLTLDELYLDWRLRHSGAPERIASLAAVNSAYADFLAGDRGAPARELLRQVCGDEGIEFDE